MFISEPLNQHLKTSNTIKTDSVVYTEWNLNDPENIEKLGNYRYRPNSANLDFATPASSYDPVDSGNFYTGATDSDIVIDSGINDEDQPILYTTNKEKMKLLYSLEDCIKPHRPRSGINKLLYLGTVGATFGQNQYLDDVNKDVARRPRFYMSSRYDQFKYWTSYRNEVTNGTNAEYGISKTLSDTVLRHYIDDAVPFVVYKEEIPTNKIAIKMQTGVGEVDLGPFRYGEESVDDPLYGYQNQQTPVRWKIEVLKNNNWIQATSFDENSTNADGGNLIGPDGYVEISYGIKVPEEYKNIFVFAQELTSSTLLPDTAPNGYAYLIKSSTNDIGEIHIYVEETETWETFVPEYGWQLSNETININSKVVTKISNPHSYVVENERLYREFDIIRGIRIVVETMNVANCTFDLIEISPRLLFDMTEYAVSFSVTKTMSDLGNNSVPVGSLSSSTGSIELFDDSFAFNSNNVFDKVSGTGSILSNYLSMSAKYLFYDVVKEVEQYDYFIPVKTLYSQGFPKISGNLTQVSIELRDFYFYLESMPAPQLLMTDVSLSYAVSMLLDYIGFSNYVFRRIENEPEIVIPYFFVAPDQNCAEVLQQLAVASQSAMFFDEYNNFVVMSKEYLMPTENQRETNYELLGQVEGQNLPNIVALASQDKKVYNSGQINYTTRYIQKAIGSVSAATKLDNYKQYIYKPVLLWEVEGKQNTKTINELGSQSSGYVLSAVPLNTKITAEIPTVLNNTIKNNIIDVGEHVYWISNFQGYFYANGEIIRYDAVEYAVTGLSAPVWVQSNQEYQEYFSRMSFNGKMYPTGNVRIYTEPEYEIFNDQLRMKDGAVKKHGRGQFGTTIVEHSAGLTDDNYWTNNSYVAGCIQNTSDYIFNTSEYINYPSTLTTGVAGKIDPDSGAGYFDADVHSTNSTRNGIMKNFMAQNFYTENEINYFRSANSGTIQSSALIFNGPSIPTGIKPADFVSYIYKDLPAPYKHFGTHMRIIGKINTGTNKSQTPTGAFSVYNGSGTSSASTTNSASNQEVKINGGSGGIAFGLNKDTNNGYFFEIISLTVDNISDYQNSNTPKVASFTILGSSAADTDYKPTCTNNVVTVYTANPVDFQVGQKVTVTGLVDANDPTNANTPLNGEYTITSMSSDKKGFTYSINASPALTTTSQTGGTASVDLAGNTIINNIVFYKVMSDGAGNAIPYKLWGGLAKINVDDGNFTGQYRMVGEDDTSVYDLSAEYVNVGTSRRFYLYINGKQVATVTDTSPLPEYNNIALFVRGTSRCMFENIYALSNNYSQNTNFVAQTGVSKIFGDEEVDATESLRKYAINGFIQQSYLNGISSTDPTQYNMYFEEFGTILREAAYFNIRYNRAFPALYAKMMKTLNRAKGYSVSGFYAGSYGAEFLIFNCVDSAIRLDDTGGNYLRIQGVSFTQNTTYTLTVDDYLKKMSNLSEPDLSMDTTLYDPFKYRQQYDIVRNSRTKYGINEFTVESPYIQTDDTAENIFGWIIDKVCLPKQAVGIETFATSTLQLGDIVTVDYISNEGIEVISPDTKRFVIYNIEYNKDDTGLKTVMHLIEV